MPLDIIRVFFTAKQTTNSGPFTSTPTSQRKSPLDSSLKSATKVVLEILDAANDFLTTLRETAQANLEEEKCNLRTAQIRREN